MAMLVGRSSRLVAVRLPENVIWEFHSTTFFSLIVYGFRLTTSSFCLSLSCARVADPDCAVAAGVGPFAAVRAGTNTRESHAVSGVMRFFRFIVFGETLRMVV